MAQSSKRDREEDDEANPRVEEVAESAPALNQAQAPPVTPTTDGPLLFAAAQTHADTMTPRSPPPFRRSYSATPGRRQPSRTPQRPPSPSSEQRRGRISGHKPSYQRKLI
jgi:hypothetical protein